MIAPLTIRLLGGFDVLISGKPMRPLRSRKGEWLTAWLILQAGRPVKRDWLVSALWPDSESLDGGLDSLRKTLYDLRQALGDERERLKSHASRALSFDLSGAEVDVSRFDLLLQRTDPLSIERITEAVTLYRGPLLPTCTEAWIEDERTKRETNYRHALDILAGHCLERQDYRGAVGYLRRAITTAPTHDYSHRRLISVLAQYGDQAAAIQVYQDFRQRLRREFNAEPEAETTDLYKRLRYADQTLKKNLYKKNLDVPVKLPAHPISPNPSGLGEDDSCIGRDREIQEIRRLILVTGTRHITITGLGGLGKTTLARRMNQELASEFPDGSCVINCVGLRTRADLVGKTCTQLGLVPTTSTPENTLLMALKYLQLLLIFDGLDGVLEASEFVEEVIRSTSSLVCVVTSRIALKTTSEMQYALGPLPYGSKSTVVMDESVRLFLSAARQTVPGYRPNPTDLRIISRICTALAGFPLMLLLAAGWLRYLTLGDLLHQVEPRRQPVPQEAKRILQADLATVVFASVDLLPAAERRTLIQLSVIAGSFFLEDAEEVCGSNLNGQLLLHLRCLKDHGLLEVSALGDRTRFFLLDAIRDCLKGNLRQSDADVLPSARRRHAAYYVTRGNATKILIQDGHWKDAMAMLWREIGNLRTVVRYAVEEKLPSIIADLTEAVGRTYLETGLLDDFEELIAAALIAADELPSLSLKARVLGLQGALARWRGQEQFARQCWEARLALYEAERDISGSMDATFDLAAQSLATGNIAIAKKQLASVFRLAYRHQLRPIIVSCLTMAAQIALTQGHRSRALRRAEAALRRLQLVLPSETTGYPCYQWIKLGRVFRQLGRYSIAASLLAQAVRNGYQSDRICDVGSAVMELGFVHEYQKHIASAAFAYAAANAIQTELGSALESQTNATLARYLQEFSRELEEMQPEIRTLTWREIIPRLLQGFEPAPVPQQN